MTLKAYFVNELKEHNISPDSHVAIHNGNNVGIWGNNIAYHGKLYSVPKHLLGRQVDDCIKPFVCDGPPHGSYYGLTHYISPSYYGLTHYIPLMSLQKRTPIIKHTLETNNTCILFSYGYSAVEVAAHYAHQGLKTQTYNSLENIDLCKEIDRFVGKSNIPMKTVLIMNIAQDFWYFDNELCCAFFHLRDFPERNVCIHVVMPEIMMYGFYDYYVYQKFMVCVEKAQQFVAPPLTLEAIDLWLRHQGKTIPCIYVRKGLHSPFSELLFCEAEDKTVLLDMDGGSYLN